MIIASDAGDLDFPVVDLPIDAESPEAIVRFLARELVRTGRLHEEHFQSVMLQVLHRESLGSTAIGRGVAIPHSKSNCVNIVVGIVGRCQKPVVWPGATDNQRVSTVCLLVTPALQPDGVLKAMESVVQYFRQGPETR